MEFLYLSTCSTCKRIMQLLPKHKDLNFRDVKVNPLSLEEVRQLAALSGSFTALINKRSQQFKISGISSKDLTEAQSEQLLVTHYSYLARPILVIGSEIFIGNSSATVAAMVNKLT